MLLIEVMKQILPYKRESWPYYIYREKEGASFFKWCDDGIFPPRTDTPMSTRPVIYLDAEDLEASDWLIWDERKILTKSQLSEACKKIFERNSKRSELKPEAFIHQLIKELNYR